MCLMYYYYINISIDLFSSVNDDRARWRQDDVGARAFLLALRAETCGSSGQQDTRGMWMIRADAPHASRHWSLNPTAARRVFTDARRWRWVDECGGDPHQTPLQHLDCLLFCVIYQHLLGLSLSAVRCRLGYWEILLQWWCWSHVPQ